MTFSWRRRRGDRNAARKNGLLDGNSELELTIPTHFRCPISLDLMKDPVTLSTGITYDRESIERWIDAGNKTCPVTNQVLQNFDLIPNHSLRKMIQDWCVQNKSHGIERIPTPRIPITPSGVKEICSKIADATKHKDVNKTRELLGRIKRLAKESERNKRCIVENGAGCALSAAFESFATISMEVYADLLKDILSGLTWMFPFGKEGLPKLASAVSFACLTWFLKGEDLTAKQNTLMVLKELLSSNPSYADGLVEIEGVAETLFKIVQVPICPAATKASLVVIYHIMSSTSSEKITPKFADMGLVPILLETLVSVERSTSEKALAVLDSICNCQQGKEDASTNALTIPIIVKKILRVSDAGTEFGVSLLWKLCKHEEDENLAIEALQVGAFQKLLVVLQVGCGQTTKEKITELLKLMNLYKDRVECFDSTSGFKYLKRSY